MIAALFKWFLRIVIVGALVAGVAAVLHRRRIVEGMKHATSQVDRALKGVERKAEDVQKSKEGVTNAVEDARRRVTQ